MRMYSQKVIMGALAQFFTEDMIDRLMEAIEMDQRDEDAAAQANDEEFFAWLKGDVGA